MSRGRTPQWSKHWNCEIDHDHYGPVDVHHIVSRGAGGCDCKANRIHLCRKAHSEVHILGRVRFPRKYGLVERWEQAIEHKAVCGGRENREP